MALTERQQLTIEGWKQSGIATNPDEIIRHCKEMLSRPVYNKGLIRPRRRHPKKYYQEILKEFDN